MSLATNVLRDKLDRVIAKRNLHLSNAKSYERLTTEQRKAADFYQDQVKALEQALAVLEVHL